MPNKPLKDIPLPEELWTPDQDQTRWVISRTRSVPTKDSPAKKENAQKKTKSAIKKAEPKSPPILSTEDLRRPKSAVGLDFDSDQYEKDMAYDRELAADEGGVKEEDLFGLFPGAEYRGAGDVLSDIPMEMLGAGIVRGVGKLAGKAGGKAIDAIKGKTAKVAEKAAEKASKGADVPLTEGTLELDLETLLKSPDKQQKLFDYVKKQADSVGGKDALLIQGGEIMPSNKGRIQRLFFKNPGTVGGDTAKDAMVRGGAEAIGSKSNYDRNFKRLLKNLQGGQGSVGRQLRNLGVSDEEIIDLLKGPK